MSDGDIERIMFLACCTEEDAKIAYSKTHDIVDAVDLLLEIPPTRGAPKAEIRKDGTYDKIRELTDKLESDIKSGFKKLDQSDCSSSQASKHTHAPVQEEMTLRSDYTLNSHLATQEEEEQTPGTVCQ